MSDIQEVSLSDQFPVGDPGWVQAKLVEVFLSIERSPKIIQELEDAYTVAEERYRRERARAQLTSTGKSQALRDSDVDIATIDAREAMQAAASPLNYAKNTVKSLRDLKDILQTMSSNLRSEQQLSGRNQT